MELASVQALARSLMAEHMTEPGWSFRFDNGQRRFGACHYHSRVISLSKSLTLLNKESLVRDTLLHEIAHALAGFEAAHGPKWKEVASKIGATPKACYDPESVVAMEGKFKYQCPKCFHVISRIRPLRKIRACLRCCKKYADGKYDEQFKLVPYHGLAVVPSRTKSTEEMPKKSVTPDPVENEQEPDEVEADEMPDDPEEMTETDDPESTELVNRIASVTNKRLLTREIRAEVLKETGHDLHEDDPALSLVVLSRIVFRESIKELAQEIASANEIAVEQLEKMQYETLEATAKDLLALAEQKREALRLDVKEAEARAAQIVAGIDNGLKINRVFWGICGAVGSGLFFLGMLVGRTLMMH